VLLAKFGGLAFAGYYEMANRVVNQIKGVVVAGTQSLIPVVIGLLPEDRKKVYLKTSSAIFVISFGIYALVVFLSGYISIIWIGHVEQIFTLSLAILSLGTIISLLNIPAYFNYMALGNLNPLIASHTIMLGSNVIISFILGMLFKGYGVIVACSISNIIGSTYVILKYNKANGVDIKTFFKLKFILLFIIGFIYLFLNLLFGASIKFLALGFLLMLICYIYIAFVETRLFFNTKPENEHIDNTSQF
jgi:O-antigen/teichoic acid export membrane protein